MCGWCIDSRGHKPQCPAWGPQLQHRAAEKPRGGSLTFIGGDAKALAERSGGSCSTAFASALVRVDQIARLGLTTCFVLSATLELLGNRCHLEPNTDGVLLHVQRDPHWT